MKKRVLTLALSLVVVVSVPACGSELKPNDESDKENTFAEDTVNEEKTIEGLCEAIHKTETEDKVITDFTPQSGSTGIMYLANIQEKNGTAPIGTFLISGEQLGAMYYEARQARPQGGMDVKDFFSSALDYLGFTDAQKATASALYDYMGLQGTSKIVDIGGYRLVAYMGEKFNYCLLSQPASEVSDYIEGQILDLGDEGNNAKTN